MKRFADLIPSKFLKIGAHVLYSSLFEAMQLAARCFPRYANIF